MNIKSNLLTTKVISPLNFEMIFTIFLLVMFVKKEAYAQERVGIRGNLDESPSSVASLDSKVDVRRNLRSVFDKLMQKTGVNKMEDFIKVEVSIFYLLRILKQFCSPMQITMLSIQHQYLFLKWMGKPGTGSPVLLECDVDQYVRRDNLNPKYKNKTCGL